MLHKTSGIILHTQKYLDTSLIVKIFTKNFGLQSYIINGVRSKKSKTPASLFQPLAIMDMQVSHSHKGGLQRITEINNNTPYYTIPYNIAKTSILLFLNEILYKAIKEAHPDEDLFEFIKNSLLVLDLQTGNCSNFHIYFIIQLSKYIGFYPHGKFISNASLFNLQEGSFTINEPSHLYFINSEQSLLLHRFMNATYPTIQQIKINKTDRKNLLQSLLVYYQLHIAGFGEIKSFEILEEVIA